MKFLRPAGLATGIVLVVSGCATLFAGGSESVRIESEPSGARVTTQNGLALGSTPLATTLNPDNYVLTFSMEGYENATYALNRKVDGIAFLNLLCVLCWGIDFATGAVWGLEDNYVKVTLGRNSAMGNHDLEFLACSNYEALDKTAEQGTISGEIRESGEHLVLAATGIALSACSGQAAQPGG